MADVPEKFKDIVKTIEGMNVLDLSELVKVLEEKFGVSAQATVVVPIQPAVGAGGETEAASVKKSVELTRAGDQKIQVIKVLREALGLGLKEAKDMADGAPIIVKQGVEAQEAEDLKTRLEAAGASVALK